MKDLQAKRALKLVELDKVKVKLEAKEKELKDLIKEISKYDDNFHSGNLFLLTNLEVGSFLDNQSQLKDSVIQNDSVINDISVMDNGYNSRSVLIEKGAIGAAGGNIDQNDANFF